MKNKYLIEYLIRRVLEEYIIDGFDDYLSEYRKIGFKEWGISEYRKIGFKEWGIEKCNLWICDYSNYFKKDIWNEIEKIDFENEKEKNIFWNEIERRLEEIKII